MKFPNEYSIKPFVLKEKHSYTTLMKFIYQLESAALNDYFSS